MLNHDVKKQAIADVEQADRDDQRTVETVQKSSLELFELRQYCSKELTVECESFINTLANAPKEFEISFDEYKAQVKEVKNDDITRKTEEQAKEINRLIYLTKQHSQGMEQILSALVKTAPSDYNQFTEDQKWSMVALINHIRSLSELLNNNIED